MKLVVYIYPKINYLSHVQVVCLEAGEGVGEQEVLSCFYMCVVF